MIAELFPDVLRSIVSTAMMIILLFTSMKPRYNTKKLAIIVIGIFSIALLSSIYFYLQKDYTTLAKFDLGFVFVVCILIKHLFKDSLMQWLFNFITASDAYIVIMVLSYILSRNMPFPKYSNTLVRFLLFVVLIFISNRYLRGINRKIQEHWQIFFFTALAFFANFSYYIMFKGNIEEMMKANIIPLMLLTVLIVIVYIGIFLALKTMSNEYELKEKNLLIQSNEDLMLLQMNSIQNRLKIIDENSRKSRIELHDRRHFDNTLLELLHRGRMDKAIELLKEKINYVVPKEKHFCSNTTVNAAITYYGAMAEKLNIKFTTKLDIPEILSVDELELSIVISNLLENAIQACEKISDVEKRYIYFTFISSPQIVFEIENPYKGKVLLDKDGYPVSDREGHGLGTKSVLIFVENQKGQMYYHVEDGIFQVRVII